MSRNINTRFRLIPVIVLLLLMSVTPAHALLTAVSPPDPVNGFPLWYQDGSGMALAPCLDPSPAPCILLADATFDPLLPIAFPTNFPSEFFYMIADVDNEILTPNTFVKVARFALEGTFANAPTVPVNGLQTVFARIRIRMTPPVPTASYTVTHPYGSITFTPPYAKGVINYTQDIPLGIPLDFTGALNGGVGPFLVWDPVFAPLAPAGYIGDAVTPHKVIGSPVGNNFFQIVGPDIGGPGINIWRTNYFILSGKIADVAALPTPLTVDRVTYSRSVTAGATTGTVDVFAHSAAAATVTVEGGPNLPAGALPLTGDGLGGFNAQIPLAPDGNTVPATVSVTAVAPLTTVTTLAANVVDVVTITKAEYDLALKTLTINASSSDLGPIRPTLTAAGGTIGTTGSLVVSGLLVPPNSVTVTSTAGGSATRLVTLVNSPAPPAETLTILRAQFSRAQRQWIVEGSTTLNQFPAGTANVITLHLGTAQGQVIGTVTPSRGRWKLSLSNSTAIANAVSRTIVAVSSAGTTSAAFTVRIR